MRVSVSVPIYNTSRYLEQCLNSLLAVHSQNIEFIMIDDGSTDDSGRICDEFTARDSRFRVIHQSNGGSAVARQSGVDNSNGEYVIVCDSDDWIEPDIYDRLYDAAKATDADIVVCGYYSEYEDGRSIPSQVIFKEENGLVDNYDFLKKGAGSSWVKLIRRSLFSKTKTSYTPDINLSEDSLIIYKLMRGNPKVVQIKANLYHYRRLFGSNSYTNNITMRHIHQLRYTYDWLKNNYTDSIYAHIIFQRAIDLAFACLRAKDLDAAYLKKFLKSELPLKSIFANRLSAKSAMAIIEKTFPIPFSQFILKSLYKFVYR